jgi:SAM-dependent methyltransferase
MTEGKVFEDNTEATAAWDGPLFDIWVRHREILVGGLSGLSDWALAKLPPPPGGRVLDIGCGLGETTREIARIVGPEGSAHGVDVASRFIEFANAEAEELGVENVSFETRDVEVADFEPEYDYAFARMGIMFFANPVAALRRIRNALVPGGELVAVVWRRKMDQTWMYEAEQAVEEFIEHPDESDEPVCGPGPFSMANADTVTDQLLYAGFEEVALHRRDAPYKVGNDLDEALDVVMSIGPAGEILRLAGERADDVRPQVRERIAAVFEKHVTEDGAVVASASSWVLHAVNPR